MFWKEKVVWITGASSGIGEALAKHLSQQGATLILSARNQEKLHSVKQACASPDKHMVLPLDLANTDEVDTTVAQALAHTGRIDILVNNGGISQRSLVQDTSVSVDRQIMEVNYLGTVALTKALLPSMLSQRSGHFVAVSSAVGKFGTPYRSAYAASKHALHGFFDSLRAELWSEGIRVTLVCPGFVRTQVSVNALTGDGTPLGTMDEAQAKGLSVEDCVKQMAHAIAKEKEEIVIGGLKEKFGVWLKRHFPGLFSRMIRSAKVR